MSLVDVVIPAFNAKETIGLAIDSVLNQSIDVVRKIIVVDDGSTDGTAGVIRKINSSKVELYSTLNQGVSSARNLGISKSHAKWVAFLDADDLWVKTKLEDQLSIAEKNNCHFVCGSINGNAQIHSGIISFSRLLLGNFIATSTVIVERSFVEKNLFSFNKEMSFAEDYLMWIQCLTVGKGFYSANQQASYILSETPRYNWPQIFLNFRKLRYNYCLFLGSIEISNLRKKYNCFLLQMGAFRSFLSIGIRFFKSYFR